MSRSLRALILCLFVASCGSSDHTPPGNLDNACAIVSERPQYLRAMKRTERKYGVPIAVQMATIHQESRFVGNARTPLRYALGVIPMGRQSSAYGYSQALDGTWDDYKKATGNRRAQRDDIRDATDFMGWYMHQTTQELRIPKWDARRQYLAYHEGRAGFSRGSYNQKPWLIAVAAKVAARAQTYEDQLRTCRRL